MLSKILSPKQGEAEQFTRIYKLLTEAHSSKDVSLLGALLAEDGTYLGLSKEQFLILWKEALEEQDFKGDEIFNMESAPSRCACCRGCFNICFDNKFFPQVPYVPIDTPRGLSFTLNGRRITYIELCLNPLEMSEVQKFVLEN